jgi:hypothetical protein
MLKLEWFHILDDWNKEVGGSTIPFLITEINHKSPNNKKL